MEIIVVKCIPSVAEASIVDLARRENAAGSRMYHQNDRKPWWWLVFFGVPSQNMVADPVIQCLVRSRPFTKYVTLHTSMYVTNWTISEEAAMFD